MTVAEDFARSLLIGHGSRAAAAIELRRAINAHVLIRWPQPTSRALTSATLSDALRFLIGSDAALERARLNVEKVSLANGSAEQALVPGVEPIDRVREDLALAQRGKLARRGHEPMPAGGLFDEVARAQPDLFG